jgi:hypothetical protein
MKRSIFYLYALAMIASYGCFKDPELGKLSSNFVVATNSAATAVFPITRLTMSPTVLHPFQEAAPIQVSRMQIHNNWSTPSNRT